jgi:hypothetical protein
MLAASSDGFVVYPLRYEDRFGLVDTVCRSNGRELIFELRGRAFRGENFNLLDVDGPDDMASLPDDQFPVDRYGDLLACFTIELPLPVLGAVEPAAQLGLSFDYRDGDDCLIDATLRLDGALWRTTARRARGFVELCLIDLQRQLPDGVFLACCLSCRWSNYYPGGNPEFGAIGCFVAWPGAADIAGKGDTIHAWHDARRQQQVHLMQETWSCPLFRLLQPGEWSYKDWDWDVYQIGERRPAP